MQQFILDTMAQFGYIGIFLLITVENIFPPIPSEVILTFGGFMTTYTDLNPWLVILVATIGSVIGAVILYLVGRILSKERLAKLFNGRLGRMLHLNGDDVVRAENWFLRRGNKAVFFCRFIPIVRSLISIPAGSADMHLAPFLALTTVGTAIWNTALVFLGRAAGGAWETIAGYFDTYSMIAIAVLVVAAAVFAFIFIKKRFIKK